MKEIQIDSVSKTNFIKTLKDKWVRSDIEKDETWKLKMRGDSYIFHDVGELHGFLIGLVFDKYFWKS